ncbi:hypothetical protein MATL_G00242800 [Megalops atlanticus]|uniref:Uncharacterized protein n=1 Tax=Megalops atlanticus TaxID=7932 RepID=A0A9D3PE68_MEGAT|nr:hypothetical protein MATL_G00242800 [Megalops atlanticus]
MEPQLSILSPKDKGPHICLATGFFPKNAEMSITFNDGDSTQLQVQDNAQLLTKKKTYFFAGVKEKEIKSCQMENVKEEKLQTDSNEGAPKDDPSKNECPTPEVKNATILTREVKDYPRMNFMPWCSRDVLEQSVRVFTEEQWDGW